MLLRDKKEGGWVCFCVYGGALMQSKFADMLPVVVCLTATSTPLKLTVDATLLVIHWAVLGKTVDACI